MKRIEPFNENATVVLFIRLAILCLAEGKDKANLCSILIKGKGSGATAMFVMTAIPYIRIRFQS